MLGVPKLGGTLLSSMRRFWALFPWRSTLFKNIPQMSQNANISGIYSNIEGNMSRGVTARDKILFFLVPIDLMYFQKKTGNYATTFQEKVFIIRKKVLEGPDLK